MAFLICYYIVGPNCSLLIELADDASTDQLKRGIRAEVRLDDVDFDQLILYRVKQTICTLGKLEILHMAVEKLFADGKPLEEALEEISGRYILSDLQLPPKYYLQFIICFPEERGRGLKRQHSELDDLEKERKLLSKITRLAPSSLATPATFKTEAQPVVSCNRPFDFETIPITLLQEEFRLFMDDHEVFPSQKSQELLQGLTVAACQWYQDEDNRKFAIQRVFRNITNVSLAAGDVTNTKYRTDGNLVNIVPPVIQECKNEEGCAFFEAIAYYAQFLKIGLG